MTSDPAIEAVQARLTKEVQSLEMHERVFANNELSQTECRQIIARQHVTIARLKEALAALGVP
jgi:hypothetical protein